MFIIGLTGGLKTGKSTVAEMFGRLGAHVIDADKVVHQLIGVDGACVPAIMKNFGKEVISKKGGINHKRLSSIVFNNEQQLRKLEKIIHPKVRLEFKKKITVLKKKNPESVIVLDVPLLFESGINRDVDLTIVVKATRAIQIERAMRDLNITKQQALQRIRLQLPMTQKVRLADVVIDNRFSKIETLKKVKQIWQKYQQNQKQ